MPGPIGTAIVVATILCWFAVLSFSASLGKSATFDEPLHLVGGMVHRYAHDFRINPEDPALFGWWASLPHKGDALPFKTSDQFFKGTITDLDQQWWFVTETLFERDPANAQHFLDVSRAMFVLVGVCLGAIIAIWAYQLAGGAAAIAAVLLYSFDPNFLAHSALVKNDVPLSLMMCLLGFFIWRFGINGRWRWLVLAALACGIAFNVKFSAVLFGPILATLLAIRGCLRRPWTVGEMEIDNWRRRIAVVVAGTVATLIAIYVLTWCVYGFRYSATADGQPLPTSALLRKAVENGIIAEMDKHPMAYKSRTEIARVEEERLHHKDLAVLVKADLWMQQHHVLPEAWLFGFLYTYANTLVRPAFLMGTVSLTGWWYYFPLAILFKTPTATLVAALCVTPLALLARWLYKRSERTPDTAKTNVDWWPAIVLTLPPAVYLLTAMTTNLNLGVRHMLPIYPYLFVALGAGAAKLLGRWPVTGLVISGLLLLGLLSETVCAYPNFLPFFNVVSGGAIGGMRLLGDSNLDWGQDLPALASWQRAHPGRLYLSYFGTADPNAYGIHFLNLAGGWPFSPVADLDHKKPGVVAISATNLQGVYLRKKPASLLSGSVQW